MGTPRGRPFTKAPSDPNAPPADPPPPRSSGGSKERAYRFEPRAWVADVAKDWPPVRIVCEGRHAPKGAWQWVAEDHDIVGVSGPGAPDAESQARSVIAELFDQARHWTQASGKRCDVRLIVYRGTGDPVETRPVRLDRDGEEDADSDVGDSSDVMALMRAFIREEHRYFIEKERVSVSMQQAVADAIIGIAGSISSISQALDKLGSVQGASRHDEMEHEATMRMYDTLDDIAERIVTPLGEALAGLITGRRVKRMNRPDKGTPSPKLAAELLAVLSHVQPGSRVDDLADDVVDLLNAVQQCSSDADAIPIIRKMIDVIRPRVADVKEAWPKRAIQIVDELAVRVFEAQQNA